MKAKSWFLPCLSIALLAVAGHQAGAAVILINNPSFETDVTATSSGTNTGWSEGGAATLTGVLNESPAAVPDTAAGVNWFWLDQRVATGGPSAIYQNLGVTVQSNTIYTLNLTIGARTDTGIHTDYIFGLFTGLSTTPTTAMAIKTEADFTLLTQGSTQGVTITFDTSLNNSFNGQNLFLRFATVTTSGAVANQILFDNLALDATAVPEPSVWGLVVLASSVFIGLSRRRSPA